MYIEPNPTEEEIEEEIRVIEKVNEAMNEAENRAVRKIRHKWYAEDSIVQDYVNYAYNLWGIDFVKLIECENGRRDPFRESATNDYWICQLNYTYNKKFINSEEYKDVYKQLDYCYNKYTYNPNLRYWPNRKINWKLCKNYVSDRFTIIE